MSSQVYPIGMQYIVNRTINYTADTLYLALLTSSYTFNTNDTAWSAISSNEVSGTGYTAGGKVVSGATIGSFVNANSWSAQWTASTAYVLGQLIRPTSGNGYLYRCVVAGTTSGSQPTWPTVIGTIVTDGGATWECAGVAAVTFTFSTVTWTGSTITAAFCVLYDHTVADALIWAGDFGGNVSSSSGTFTVPPDAVNGAFVVVVG